MSFFKLRDEIINDPLSKNYASMTNAQIVASLRAKTIDNWITLDSAQIFEAIDQTEFKALNAAQQARVDRILSLGSNIATAPGSQARNELISIFGVGSATISALITLANQKISRGEEIGFGEPKESDIIFARSL